MGMDKENVVRIAANRLAAILYHDVGVGLLGIDSDGKLRLPLQPFGLTSIRFPLAFSVRCTACLSGWMQPLEEKSPLSFLRHIFSESGSIKLSGLHCENKSCVLNKQIVPMAMIMEVVSNSSFTVESRVLAKLDYVSKVGDIDSKKDHLRVASVLATGTEYQGIIQELYIESSRIMSPVTQDQWHRLDELVDSAIRNYVIV